MNDSEAVVTLRSGQTVPLVALELLWHLEDRGLHVHVYGGGVLVGPQGRLTDGGGAAGPGPPPDKRTCPPFEFWYLS